MTVTSQDKPVSGRLVRCAFTKCASTSITRYRFWTAPEQNHISTISVRPDSMPGGIGKPKPLSRPADELTPGIVVRGQSSDMRIDSSNK